LPLVQRVPRGIGTMSSQQPSAIEALPRRRWIGWTAFVVALAAIATGLGFWSRWPSLPEEGPVLQDLAPEQRSASWFRDATAATGIDVTYRNGEEAGHLTILETLGGGVALLDYDGDGLLDIFVTGGGSFSRPRTDYPDDAVAYAEAVKKSPPTLVGRPCKLYRNRGNGQFEDVTVAAGLAMPWFYTHGCAVADYDRDGWPDLLVTGYGAVRLLHNEPDGRGGRHLVDVTASMGLMDTSWATSAGWADLDGDGWPDLYICHYLDWSFANHPACTSQAPPVRADVCPPQRFKPLVHGLWRNEGGKGFRDMTASAGFKAVGCGLGVVLADLDGDGRPDIYVANDATNKLLFMNRGGKLEECAREYGVDVDDTGHYNGSMGVDCGDYDGSGRPSLWVTNFQGDLHNLYRNIGGGLFEYQSRAAGLAAIGQHFVGFGTGFIDFDNDGWEDLVIVNGHVVHFPILGSTIKQRPVLLRNIDYRGRRFFKDVSVQGGEFFQEPRLGRGLAVGDLDNDGWPDLVISHTNSPVVVLRNEAGKEGNTAHWIGVSLVGKKHRDIVGSAVTVESGGRRLTRFLKGGGSYLSSSDRRLLFGLGSVSVVDRVTVRWSWGEMQSWEGLTADGYWELREGNNTAHAAHRGRYPNAESRVASAM
jgi:hypothetical protein